MSVRRCFRFFRPAGVQFAVKGSGGALLSRWCTGGRHEERSRAPGRTGRPALVTPPRFSRRSGSART